LDKNGWQRRESSIPTSGKIAIKKRAGGLPTIGGEHEGSRDVLPAFRRGGGGALRCKGDKGEGGQENNNEEKKKEISKNGHGVKNQLENGPERKRMILQEHRKTGTRKKKSAKKRKAEKVTNNKKNGRGKRSSTPTTRPRSEGFPHNARVVQSKGIRKKRKKEGKRVVGWQKTMHAFSKDTYAR